MRTIKLIILCAALAACSDKGAESSLEGLQAANSEYDRALIAGDAAALENTYTADYSIIDDDADIHGRQDQIRMMTQVVDLLEARSDDVKITPLGPDSALLTGRLNGRYRVAGEENTFTERYTSVWVRQDGEWKIRHEHASLVPKPEATPAT